MRGACVLFLVGVALSGCSSVSASGDAVAPVDVVEGRCVWTPFFPRPDPCDGSSREFCAELGFTATQGTSLVPYVTCVGAISCAWGDVCDRAGCTCGGIACGDGEICARRPSEITPTCVRCDIADS